jgi:hypothetical protein
MFWMHAYPLLGQVGGEISSFLGPQMALPYPLDAISQGPKNSQFSGSNPLQRALIKDMHTSKTLREGLYNIGA